MEGKMELDMRWADMNSGIEREKVIEVVTAEFLRMLERNRMVSPATAADRTGYSKKAIYSMLSREKSNLVLSQEIVIGYPEIGLAVGEPIVCSRCGRLPHFGRN